MSRQFKISIYPSLRPKSNINYSISLKNGYIKSKESLFDTLKHSPSIQSPSTLKKMQVSSKKKRTISVVDFSDILKDRFKLPSIGNTIQSIKLEESVLIKEGHGIPPTKSQKSKFLKIPTDVTHMLQLKLVQELQKSKNKAIKKQKQKQRKRSLNLVPKFIKKKISVSPQKSDHLPLGIQMQIKNTQPLTKNQNRLFKRKIKLRDRTQQKSKDLIVYKSPRVNEFMIQPWQIANQLKSTITNFYSNRQEQTAYSSPQSDD